MEWGASRILALRKHAGMTQSQFAKWLGVSIKQVKYLEHQRRNPSGPARRLLGILAGELKFDGVSVVQVLGASVRKPRTPVKMESPAPAPPVVPENQTAVDEQSGYSPEPVGGAFVWQ